MFVVILAAGQARAWAAWLSSSNSSGIRQVQAATLSTAPAPTATQNLGGRTVGLAWSGVPFATSYELQHYTAATGGAGTVACSSSGTSCVDSTARTGSAHWYSVVARVGTNWVSESPRTSYASDDATTVSIATLGSDTGTSATDFITRTSTNSLSGTAEAGADIVVRRAGTQIATATASVSGGWISTPFALIEGLQDIDVVATDAYGNTAALTRSNVRLDTVAPEASQSAPCASPGLPAPSGTWCKQTTLNVTAAYSDTGSGLLAGSTKFTLFGGAPTAYTGPISLSEVNGGTVQLTATDLAGNVVTTDKIYYLDGTAPSLTVTAPTSGLSLSLAALGSLLDSSCSGNIGCGTASDTMSGLAAVTAVKWQLSKGSTCYTATGTASCTGYAYQDAGGVLPNWVVPRSRVGFYTALSTYSFSAQVTDRAGNATTSSFTYSTLL
ncbi:Ig-like domain-containing protein [Aeromicrobium sp.]|uniref:Ig-like domain-containing protein n=1 Tax=Aeromicrobium sp. TaxID=1871063 RepID=UPI003C6FE8CC